MTGTKAGGKKASLTNKMRHGDDFYQRIGRRGGKNGHTGGFASNPALAKIAGRKGGSRSRRKSKLEGEKEVIVYLYEAKNMSIKEIARKYNVSQSTISLIIRKQDGSKNENVNS